MMGTERGQGLLRPSTLQRGVPRVPGWLGFAIEPACDGVKLALFAGLTAPVVDELVAGDADQPGRSEIGDGVAFDRADGGQERLRREIFGDGVALTSRPKVTIDLADGAVVQRQQHGARVTKIVRFGRGHAPSSSPVGILRRVAGKNRSKTQVQLTIEELPDGHRSGRKAGADRHPSGHRC